MQRDEIEEICRQVLANRKSPRAPLARPLPLAFRNCRFPTSAEDLDPAEQRQAVAVGQDGIGQKLSPDELFGEDALEEGMYQPEIWDVLDAEGGLACRVWLYGVDNGTVFRGDTTEILAGCSQGGVDSRDGALVDALIDARKRLTAEEIPPQSCIRSFGS